MSLSLNVLIQFVIIFVFVCIFGWNLLSAKEGIDEGEGEGEGGGGGGEEDVEIINEMTEIIDAKTGKKRKMTKREKRAADKKRAKAQKEQNDDMDERFNSYKG